MSTKRALLIGINDYEKSYIRNLRGCVNDSQVFQSVLQDEFGFLPDNIASLIDEKATRQAILDEFDKLVENTEANDVVVIHYSGHGSQVTDQEGDEPDKLDETIVPHDSGLSKKGDQNRDITDDYIYGFVRRLNEKTPYVTLIFDSCHSGTMARDIFGGDDRWREPDVWGDPDDPDYNPDPNDPEYQKHLALLPPPYEDEAVIEELRGLLDSRDVGGEGKWLPIGEKYVLIAGCRDEERSYEFRAPGSVRHGVLTFHLCQELRDASPGTSYRTVFEQASASVTARKPAQHPQMEGARSRELFGQRDVPTMRYIGVEMRDGKKVTLKGGAAHGLTPDSEWAIYSAETNEVTDEMPSLGLVKIRKVRAVTADAIILADQSDNWTEIQAGCRAVEYAHHYGEMRLVVKLEVIDQEHAQDVEELKELIEDSELLRLTADDDEAEWCVYLLPQRTEDEVGDHVPQIGALPEATWVVVSRDGQNQPPHAVSESDAVYTVFENLERTARYQMAWELKNPESNNKLRGVVEVTIMRKTASGDWEAWSDEDIRPAFNEGDLFGMVIENVSKKTTVFVTVLNFGMAGAIKQLHPVGGASEELKPGGKIKIGIREDDELPVSIPDNFPNDKDIGDDHVKLIITSHPADFSHLVQEGWRGIPDSTKRGKIKSPIEELMTLALTGHGTRDMVRRRPKKVEQWLTIRREFNVVR